MNIAAVMIMCSIHTGIPLVTDFMTGKTFANGLQFLGSHGYIADNEQHDEWVATDKGKALVKRFESVGEPIAVWE